MRISRKPAEATRKEKQRNMMDHVLSMGAPARFHILIVIEPGGAGSAVTCTTTNSHAAMTTVMNAIMFF